MLREMLMCRPALTQTKVRPRLKRSSPANNGSNAQPGESATRSGTRTAICPDSRQLFRVEEATLSHARRSRELPSGAGWSNIAPCDSIRPGTRIGVINLDFLCNHTLAGIRFGNAGCCLYDQGRNTEFRAAEPLAPGNQGAAPADLCIGAGPFLFPTQDLQEQKGTQLPP
jgi:hypothetical protein